MVALLVAIFLAKKIQHVDPKPAVALGEEYFSQLKRGQTSDALAMYSDEFRRQHGEQWRQLLTGIDERYGTVSEFTVLDAKTAPVGEVACIVVRYKVTRNLLFSEEKLTVCPEKANARMSIAGHEIVRLDTGQQTTAGVTFTEVNLISVGGATPNTEKRTPLTVTPAAVRNAADEFYNLMSAAQYDAIYEASGDDFKASGSRDQLLHFLNEVGQEIGNPCYANTLIKETVSPSETGDLMYLSYVRDCNNVDVHDGVSWKFMHGKPLLASYYLNSPDGRNLPVIDAEQQQNSADLAEKAKRSTDSFYRKVSAQQYDAVFDLVGEQLRTSEKREMLLRFLKQIKQTAGICKTPILSETSYTTSTAGFFVELTYTRSCANREITEHYNWKIAKGEAMLDGYYVDGLTK
jgi:hypothetical protein